MKSLFIFDKLVRGGAELATLNLCHEFSRKTNCVIVCRFADPELVSKLPQNVSVIGLRWIAMVLHLFISRGKYDVVFCSNWRWFLFLYVRKTLFRDFTLILREAIFPVFYLGKFSLLSLIRRAVSGLAYRKACIVVCPSDGVFGCLKAWIPELENKLVVVPNGNHFRDRPNSSGSTIEGPKIQLNNQKFCVAVGRFAPQKNWEKILSCFDKYAELCQLSGVEPGFLVCVGSGVESQRFQDLINQKCKNRDLVLKVTTVGGNVRNLFRQASVMLCWPTCEGFPNVVKECLQAGTPVVGPRFEAGLKEILTYSNGYFTCNDIGHAAGFLLEIVHGGSVDVFYKAPATDSWNIILDKLPSTNMTDMR